jgi:hypothetical protein
MSHHRCASLSEGHESLSRASRGEQFRSATPLQRLKWCSWSIVAEDCALALPRSHIPTHLSAPIMRPPSSSRALARQEILDRLRRDRAAALALRVAFPAIQQLRLELSFEDGTSAIPPASQSHVLHPPARAFFEFPCPHQDCDGRFDLTAAVNVALTDTARRAEGMLECPGDRPHRNASRKACQLRLVYAITAIYQRGS